MGSKSNKGSMGGRERGMGIKDTGCGDKDGDKGCKDMGGIREDENDCSAKEAKDKGA